MDSTPTFTITESSIKIAPISHASMVLLLGGQAVYTDPVGETDLFARPPRPDMILVTDLHPDHLNVSTISGLFENGTILVVPQVVADLLPENSNGTVVVLQNGEKITQKGIGIEAIPMYNIPESESTYHTKGRGNGYVLSCEGKMIYIAGDTSATPEMKALKNIDIAFIPMNLPYTMSVQEAAEGVLAFKPKTVHPYHYRSSDGFSDIVAFKQLVESKDNTIKVELLNFYPGQ